jgi:RNA polymerase sigma factor (sigma-70 family)
MEMVAAGMEGISQGIAKFDPTKNTKMSTFMFSRARFAISKYYQKLIREKKKQIVSLNAVMDDNETEFFTVVSDSASDDILDTVTRNIEKQALFTVMGRLSERDRAVLRLCAENNATFAAKQLNIPTSKVKDLLETVKEKIVAEVSLNS